MRTIAFLLFIIVIMGFVITNPKPQDHRSYVVQVLNQSSFKQTPDPQSISEGIGRGLGLVLGSVMLESMIAQAEYRNFFLFSILNI